MTATRIGLAAALAALALALPLPVAADILPPAGMYPDASNAVLPAARTNLFPSPNGGALLVGSGSDWVSRAASGDCTLSSAGGLTCTKTNGAAFGALATLGVGTGLTNSGGNLNLTSNSVTLNGHALALGGALTLAFSDFSGSIAASQLPNPSASTLGGVESVAAVSHQWLRSISTSGVPAASQPACGDLSDASAFCNGTSAANLTGTLAVANGGTGDAGTAWSSYTPSLSCGSGSLTSAAATGRYKTLGKTVWVEMHITIATNGSCGAWVYAALPVVAAANRYILAGLVYETGKSATGAILGDANTSFGYIRLYDGTYPAADNTHLVITGVYESN
jgi:hypothetical protein